MPLPGRIVLIGFMGSGKSTVGRILAGRLGRRFLDTDALVEERTGKAVATVFAEQGEAGFRDAEAAVLAGLAGRGGVVVATGGGAPAQPRNAWFFSTDAATFHLRVTLSAARERTRGSSVRPLMDREDAEVRGLFQSRLPLYDALGTAVDTDGRTPMEVAEEILRLLEGPRETRRPGGGV